jgi:glycosyltransferase involved in cell wall biosynthesis
MRVTFVLPPADLSGGSRVASIHAEGLRRRGHHVVAVSVRTPRTTLRDAFRSVMKGKGLPALWTSRSPSHFDDLEVEHRRLNHSGPVTDADVPEADVVIGTWWETVAWVAGLTPSRGVKVHFVQGYDIFGGPPETVDATYRLPIPKIVISEWLRNLLQTKFNQTPVALVPNSVETDKFFASPRGKQAVPTVGMIYSTDPNKGCATSIQAYERAARELPGLRMVSMGSCQISKDLPLPQTAEFTYRARDQQLRAIYSRCDAWLYGSRVEGFGLPLLEAMACRTPVIATPGGAAPELVAKGGGLLVPHDDAPAMARAVVQICSLPDAEWRALSDAALATATGFTWEDAIDQFEKALVQVVEGSKQRLVKPN